MGMIDGMLAELTVEAENTRAMLERVPDNLFDWQPHAKSMTMGHLASHLADIPSWVAATLNMDEMVIGPDYKPFHASNIAEVLETFDAKIAEAKAAMPGYPDDKLMQNWALKMGGEEMFRMPRAQCLRAFVLSHTVHHRAQLGVYLRLNDIALPSTYGPSADDQG